MVKHAVANFIGTRIKNVKSGKFGLQRFLLTYWAYRLLPLFGFDYCRLVEWKFILDNLPRKKGLDILDVGCTSSLFIHKLSRYGKAIGIDSRPYFENLPRHIKFYQCDISNMPFADNSFDCITMISVIEHVGLGAYRDPKYDDGDFKAMRELRRLLKPGGVLFLTTLIGKHSCVDPTGSQRIYDLKRFESLKDGYRAAKEEYFIFAKKWRRVSRKRSFEEPSTRFGLACAKLVKT